MKFRVVVFSFLFLCGLAAGQQAKPAQPQTPQRPPWLDTPEVHSDNSVTFRFLAPNAQEVKLAREGTEQVAMQKDDKGRLDREHCAVAARLLRILHHCRRRSLH